MIRNVKYIDFFIFMSENTYDENVKIIYKKLSKRNDYKKTNQYIFIQNQLKIEVYQLLNIVPKYPKPFYKDDIVECKEHGKGKVVKINSDGCTRLEVLFENGITDNYTYYGYKYPNKIRNNQNKKDRPFLDDKLVKIV